MDANIKSPPPVTCPLPEKPKEVTEGEVLMDFDGAVKAMLGGKRVTRLEWKNEKIYFLIESTRLKIHRADGVVSDLTLQTGDLEGTDYIII